MTPDLLTVLFVTFVVIHVGAVQVLVALLVARLFRRRCPRCRR